MMNENMINENETIELNEESMEQVAGGKNKVVKCIVSEANVRTGPAKSYAVIGHLYKGDKVTYKGEHKKDKEGNMWVCVTKSGKYGWVRKDMLG